MPSLSRCRRSAQLSFIAKQVYGSTPVRPYVTPRLAPPVPRVSQTSPRMALIQASDGTTSYLGQMRVAPEMVAVLQSLLAE